MVKEHDYAKLGLKSGLEIHQQLDTGKKLFCRCPAFLRKDEPDISVMRKLHAVAGETGEVDVAVEFEANLGKEFYYQGYKDSTCLIEFDEEPPKFVDKDALNETLKIALLLNCDIYSASQIMRKTVIDGSNTSGFQRTVMVAHSGYIETSFGEVGIKSIALEEDSARIVSKDKDKAVYRLDRLGIPLVEITTEPDMKTPEQVKEAALKIGEIIRACRVKRGIGTIRQDVNISIKGHDRVEIKGFQDPKIMINTVDFEIERQLEAIKKKKTESGVRKVLDDGKTEFLRPMPGGARMYPETDLPLLKMGREKINEIKKILPKMRHEIRDELKKKGLNNDLIELVLKSDSLEEFSILMKVYSKDANLVGKMVSLWRSEFASKSGKSVSEVREILSERVMEQVLEKLREGKLDKGHVRNVLVEILDGKDIEEALRVEKIDEDELEEEIRKIVKGKPGLTGKAYMGLVMGKMKGKIDARKAMEILNRIVE